MIEEMIEELCRGETVSAINAPFGPEKAMANSKLATMSELNMSLVIIQI